MRATSTILTAAAALAAAVYASGCTETPGYFPPCIDPYTPCEIDGGEDAGADAGGGAGADADAGVGADAGADAGAGGS